MRALRRSARTRARMAASVSVCSAARSRSATSNVRSLLMPARRPSLRGWRRMSASSVLTITSVSRMPARRRPASRSASASRAPTAAPSSSSSSVTSARRRLRALRVSCTASAVGI